MCNYGWCEIPSLPSPLIALGSRPSNLLPRPQGAWRLYRRDHTVVLNTQRATHRNLSRRTNLNMCQIVMLQIQYLHPRFHQPVHQTTRNPTAEPVIIQVQILHRRKHRRHLARKLIVAEINGRDHHLVNRLNRTAEPVPLELKIIERESENLRRDNTSEPVQAKIQVTQPVHPVQDPVHRSGQVVP